MSIFKLDFDNFLTKPIEEKVRNPFFLALIVSVLSYNKKFIFTEFLPADDWDQRWSLLGEEWMAVVWWYDYPLVVGLALLYTIGFYAAAYVTYVIAMLYDKRLIPWVGNKIFKKGFVERYEHERLKSSFQILEKRNNELIEDARKLNTRNQGYQDSIGSRDRGLNAAKREMNVFIDTAQKELIGKFRIFDGQTFQSNQKISDKLTKESNPIFQNLKVNTENLFNDSPTFDSIKTLEER